jgi:hypothetical protein
MNTSWCFATITSTYTTYSVLWTHTSYTRCFLNTIRILSIKICIILWFYFGQIRHWYFFRRLIISHIWIYFLHWVLDKNRFYFFTLRNWFLLSIMMLSNSCKIILSSCMNLLFLLRLKLWLCLFYFLNSLLLNYWILMNRWVSLEEINNLLNNLFISYFMMLLRNIFNLFRTLIIFKNLLSMCLFDHLIILWCDEQSRTFFDLTH